MRPSVRTEPVTVLTERGVKQRLQHLQDCLLDHPVQYCGDAQEAFPTVWLRQLDPAQRLRSVAAVL